MWEHSGQRKEIADRIKQHRIKQPNNKIWIWETQMMKSTSNNKREQIIDQKDLVGYLQSPMIQQAEDSTKNTCLELKIFEQN